MDDEISLIGYTRRIFSLRQMSFDYAFYQMLSVCINPSKMYNLTNLSKEAKQHWHRDDPAFVMLIIAGLAICALGYTTAFADSFWGLIRLLVHFILIHFIGTGLIVSYINYQLAVKYLRYQNAYGEEKSQKLEFLYCWDLHCNSFFPLFMIIYVLQFFGIPFLTMDNFISALVSNLIHCFAFSYYHFITCKGFSALGFIQNAEIYLAPIILYVPLFILFIALRINPTTVMLNLFF